MLTDDACPDRSLLPSQPGDYKREIELAEVEPSGVAGISRPDGIGHDAPRCRSVGAVGWDALSVIHNSWDEHSGTRLSRGRSGSARTRLAAGAGGQPAVPGAERFPSVRFARRASAFADLPGAAGDRTVEL